MKYDMMNEVKEKEEPVAAEKSELSDEQKEKLSQAMSILKGLAAECNCSPEELLSQAEAPEASEEEESVEVPSEEESEAAPADDKKMALYIAQLRAKKE
jgi:hypothetical protein